MSQQASVSEIDLNHFVFTDDTVANPKQGYPVERYLHGRCHIFAAALKAVYQKRAQIFCVLEVDSHREQAEGYQPILCHAYAVLDGKSPMDARGAIGQWNLDSYSDDVFESVTLPFESSEVENLMHDKAWGAPEDGEIEALTSFIKENSFMYESDTHILDDEDPKVECFRSLITTKFGDML